MMYVMQATDENGLTCYVIFEDHREYVGMDSTRQKACISDLQDKALEYLHGDMGGTRNWQELRIVPVKSFPLTIIQSEKEVKK